MATLVVPYTIATVGIECADLCLTRRVVAAGLRTRYTAGRRRRDGRSCDEGEPNDEKEDETSHGGVGVSVSKRVGKRVLVDVGVGVRVAVDVGALPSHHGSVVHAPAHAALAETHCPPVVHEYAMQPSLCPQSRSDAQAGVGGTETQTFARATCARRRSGATMRRRGSILRPL